MRVRRKTIGRKAVTVTMTRNTSAAVLLLCRSGIVLRHIGGGMTAHQHEAVAFDVVIMSDEAHSQCCQGSVAQWLPGTAASKLQKLRYRTGFQLEFLTVTPQGSSSVTAVCAG